MGGNDKILGRLDSLLKECESKISKIELRLPEYEEPSESLSRRVAQLLEPEPPEAAVSPPPIAEEPPAAPAQEAAPQPVVEEPASMPEPAFEPEPALVLPAPIGVIEDKREAEKEVPEAAVPERLPFWRRSKRPAMYALAAGALGALIWAANGLRAKQRIFTLPADSLAGLTFSPDGGLFSMDLDRGALVAIGPQDGKARLKDVMSIAIPKARGLAWGSGGLWIAGGRSGLLYRYASVTGSSNPQRYPQFHRYPVLISISQDNLVTVDEEGKRIDKYLISQALTGVSLALLGSYPLPAGVAPGGICESNGEIWLLDQAAPAIRRYKESGSALKPLDYFDLKPWLGNGARPAGLALGGGAVWLMDSASRTLHRFRLGAISWKPPAGSGAGRH